MQAPKAFRQPGIAKSCFTCGLLQGIEDKGESSGKAMATIVKFENVGLRYGTGAETLSDLSFSLGRGGFYFLTGASGAGKTSLLRLLFLAQRPSRGLIRLFGEDMVTLERDRLPLFRRRIGVVFQDFRLIPHLSAFDNVALPLRVAGTDEREIEKPVNEMLAWVGLGDRASARPATLSGGEQQMLAIGRALMARPRLLLMDEPSMGLSPVFVDQVFDIIKEINGQGTTVLVVEQNASVALAIANRGYVLQNGRIAVADTAQALLAADDVRRAYLGED